MTGRSSRRSNSNSSVKNYKFNSPRGIYATNKNIPNPSTTPTPSPSTISTPSTSTPSTGNGFFSAITQGFGFGMGSSLGHKVVGGIFGSNNENKQDSTISHTNLSPSNLNQNNTLDITNSNYTSKYDCKKLQEDYLNCLNNLSSNECDFLLNIFKQCEES